MKKYTLVTGASSGIGKELAIVFAENGYNLILVAQKLDILDELSKNLSEKHKIHVLPIACNLSDANEIEKLIDLLNTAKIEIEILINNAGIGDFTLFSESEKSKNNLLLDINIKALVSLTHYVLPAMISRQSGRILNVASMAAYMPGPFIAVYAATKAFVLNFSRALAIETDEHGVQVSVLSPGDIQTKFQEKANLKGYQVRSNISVRELADYTFKMFINEKQVEILMPETKNSIEMMSRSGDLNFIGKNLYKMRKKLAQKLKNN